MGHRPAAMAEAEPLEDPIRHSSEIVRIARGPWCGLTPATPMPILCMFNLPNNKAPACAIGQQRKHPPAALEPMNDVPPVSDSRRDPIRP